VFSSPDRAGDCRQGIAVDPVHGQGAVDSPRSDRHYGAVERFVRTLPGIRHIIRLLVFAFYDIRFIAFRRYRGSRESVS